jgi:integrase
MNKIQEISNEIGSKNSDYLLFHPSEEILSKLHNIERGQKSSQKEIRLAFSELETQNQELLEVTKNLSQQLETVVVRLNLLKKEGEKEKIPTREEAELRVKKLLKPLAMTPQIYKKLIHASEGPTYLQVRLRLAFCLLAVTGIQISELLPLKVGQIQTLRESGSIEIYRSKEGGSSHRAFLTKEGKKLINDRKRDFEFIFLMKTADSYIFTAENNHSKMLRRETMIRAVNKIIRLVSSQMPEQSYITSHSFRIGYITKLWKDINDIQFVRQTIGQQKLVPTSVYVQNLFEEERQKINKI